MRWLLYLLVSFLAFPCLGESAPPTMTVIASSDATDYNLGSSVQYALAQLYRRTKRFNVQLSAYELGDFKKEQTEEAHIALVSPLFSFAYIEPQRLSLFLFNDERPGQFLVAAAALPRNSKQLSSRVVEGKLIAAFKELLVKIRGNKYEWLPGASPTDKSNETGPNSTAKARALEAGRLFRELSSLQTTPLFIGANLGMARMTDTATGSSVAFDGISFGGFVGYRFLKDWQAELALDFNTHAVARLDAKYNLPIAGKYIKVQASVGAAYVLALFTQNSILYRDALITPQINPGSLLVGPGAHIDIPMLGAHIRAGVHFYLGSGSILLGSYGASYGIKI